MFSKKIYTLYALLFSFLLFSGCGSTVSNVADSSTVQSSAVDDLDASLEESVHTLATQVSDMRTRVMNLEAPAGTEAEQHSQYFELLQEISDIEQRIDELEDTVERQYLASQISKEAYLQLDHELESLEDSLDQTEDQLEIKFGYDD